MRISIDVLKHIRCMFVSCIKPTPRDVVLDAVKNQMWWVDCMGSACERHLCARVLSLSQTAVNWLGESGHLHFYSFVGLKFLRSIMNTLYNSQKYTHHTNRVHQACWAYHYFSKRSDRPGVGRNHLLSVYGLASLISLILVVFALTPCALRCLQAPFWRCILRPDRMPP